MDKLPTIHFVATPELKQLLEEWAKEDDRSLSATLRRLIEAEARRRKGQQQSKREVEYKTG
jgi:DNA-binding HxlR family transcriptional regulator